MAIYPIRPAAGNGSADPTVVSVAISGDDLVVALSDGSTQTVSLADLTQSGLDVSSIEATEGQLIRYTEASIGRTYTLDTASPSFSSPMWTITSENNTYSVTIDGDTYTGTIGTGERFSYEVSSMVQAAVLAQADAFHPGAAATPDYFVFQSFPGGVGTGSIHTFSLNQCSLFDTYLQEPSSVYTEVVVVEPRLYGSDITVNSAAAGSAQHALRSHIQFTGSGAPVVTDTGFQTTVNFPNALPTAADTVPSAASLGLVPTTAYLNLIIAAGSAWNGTNFTVTAGVNDTVTVGGADGVQRTGTLAPGSYTPADLVTRLAVLMRTLGCAVEAHQWGGSGATSSIGLRYTEQIRLYASSFFTSLTGGTAYVGTKNVTRALAYIAPSASGLHRAGQWYGPTHGTISTSTALSSTQAQFARFVVPEDGYYDMAQIWVITAGGATDTIRLGVYEDTGSSIGNLVAEIGQISLASTGLKNVNMKLWLKAGSYMVGGRTKQVSATARLMMIGADTTGNPLAPLGQYMNGFVNSVGATVASGADDLPLSFTGGAANNTSAPHVMLRRAA